MSRYQGIHIFLTSVAIAAAFYIGLVQNSINQKLVNINYEPSLSITYAEPANDRASGLTLTNNGKTNITLHNVSLFSSTISDDERTFSGNSAMESVVAPGTTVNIGGPNFLASVVHAVRASNESNFLLNVFFKTPDDQKYVMEATITGIAKDGSVNVYLDSTRYRKFDWHESD